MPITNEQHVANQGASCPFCGSDDIDGNFVEVEADKAYQNVMCLDCSKSWTDVYVLDLYELIKE